MAYGNSTRGSGQIWQQVLAGDVTAYQSVVEYHQSAVAAVAYSILGDFSSSQDVAQETFWIAWTRRNSLRDASRLGSWLCGIARNLAKQMRRQLKRMKTGSEFGMALEPVADGVGPLQKSVSDEEQKLVWGALEQMPEKYREVVTLYYRQGQSIAQVAETTGISDETARQRLSRGRTMLRGRVAQLIEGVLEKNNPDARFTARVMAGIVGAGVAGKTAGAASASLVSLESAATAAGSVAAAAKGVVATGAAAGMLGGAAGTAGGLLGGWLGIWLPAQLAPTETERQLVLERGRAVMRASILFAVGVLVLTLAFVYFRFYWLYFTIGLLAMMAAHGLYIMVQTLGTAALVRDLRSRVTAKSDPNRSAFKARFGGAANSRPEPDRAWTSRACLFGLPLVDIRISSPSARYINQDHPMAVARGWIAIGDRAIGILFGAGGVASGLISVGGVCVGVVSFGGLCCGVVSLGGLAIGVFALGGMAVGWDTAGGLAVGWHSAAGGMAVAWHAAFGGMAIAHNYAVGGGAIAAESNSAAAQAAVQTATFQWLIEWVSRNQIWVIVGSVLMSLPPVLFFLWINSRLIDVESAASLDEQKKRGD